MAILDKWQKDLEDILTKICSQQCRSLCPTKCSKIVNVNYAWDFLASVLEKQFHLKYDHVSGLVGTGVIREISSLVYADKNSHIKAPTRIEGQVYIGENTVINPNSYIRGPVIIGDNCVVGGEIKKSIILNGSKLSHQVYVGDSVIGRNCLLGAGVRLANFKLNAKSVVIEYNGARHYTNRKKFGAVLEDNVEVGCNSVLNPGVYIHQNNKIDALKNVSGEKR